MDPRTGSFGESRQPKRPAGEKPVAKTGKLKTVTLMVERGYEIHSVTIGPRNWKKIQEGKEWGTGGETYYYEGEPGSLIVNYGNDGGEGYCGKWASVDITEHYA
jgi:hypothetical protein